MDDVIPLNVFAERHSDICTMPQLRWWIFNRHENGIESGGAIVKKAGRWYVVVPKFRDWLLAGDEAA